ncbi:hypothetical protein [Cupriavidus basilensis]|uniref:hypothetical protein n=1 Tax=Cupriavidus basilensis TaxID=68895 RepID=UPI001D589530|nr:hypothetical protein [Cupriavidus basilensis]NUA25996.1 hypothetical protein [Cupriavidus basilensis]
MAVARNPHELALAVQQGHGYAMLPMIRRERAQPRPADVLCREPASVGQAIADGLLDQCECNALGDLLERSGYVGQALVPRRGRLQDILVDQVQDARIGVGVGVGVGVGGSQRFIEQHRQEPVKAGFGRQRLDDVEKPLDGPLHAVQRHGKFLDLADARFDVERPGEFETPDGLRPVGQGLQGLLVS